MKYQLRPLTITEVTALQMALDTQMEHLWERRNQAEEFIPRNVGFWDERIATTGALVTAAGPIELSKGYMIDEWDGTTARDLEDVS
jgi:hypothetical protein